MPLRCERRPEELGHIGDRVAAHGLIAADGRERGVLEVVSERAADQPELLLERLGAQTPLVEIAIDRVAARQPEIRRCGAVAIDVLREGCQAQRELVGRLHEQIRASAVDVRFVHVVAAIGKVVDEAAVVGVEPAHAERGLVVGERSIDRGGGIVADAATRGIREPCARSGAERTDIRQYAHILEQAAHRARAVQRALRAAQDLDPRHVEQPDIERQLRARCERRARAIRDFVDVDAHGRRDVVARRDATQVDLRRTDAAGREGQARHGAREVAELRGPERFEIARGDRRHGQRRLAQLLLELLRRDHYFLEHRHVGRSLCRRCRDSAQAQQAGCRGQRPARGGTVEFVMAVSPLSS